MGGHMREESPCRRADMCKNSSQLLFRNFRKGATKNVPLFLDEEEKAVGGCRQQPRACGAALVPHAPALPRLPFATRILRSTVVLELCVLVLVTESFHDACHRNRDPSTNLAADLTHAPSKSRPPGPRHANRRCSNAPQGPEEKEEARKSRSSFSGHIPTNRGSDTCPPTSSLSSTRANLPELFALLATQRESDQGKQQRNDFEELTKASVHRRRGGPPTKNTLGERRVRNAIFGSTTIIRLQRQAFGQGSVQGPSDSRRRRSKGAAFVLNGYWSCRLSLVSLRSPCGKRAKSSPSEASLAGGGRLSGRQACLLCLWLDSMSKVRRQMGQTGVMDFAGWTLPSSDSSSSGAR
ncbi:hypothetical protein HPB51_026872 [Rhipicephalus microplus]|uniref:Uncharacterized protein n=1 Tax=Rhipicephalus microplus TaxID=6941 RepID=A0A9J6D252_RHIMP|nr:hypothetical protein HPB51_026872 [Rhipicephalus microplus]